jgi:predicted metal-dependent phosphoesterase TrpH
MAGMTLQYDLHTHSSESDGTLSPAALVRAAHDAGVEVLALTDHDTTAGISAARRAAAALGLRFVPGVEISVNWRGLTLHILGLNIDPACRALQVGLARLRAARDRRAAEIGRRLEKAGIHDACEGACALAQGSIVSRTHFAQYLVTQGHATSVREVFKHYLVRGKPGYAAGEWADMEEALHWIASAGGLAVIAHPARYRLTASRLRRLLGEFRAAGGAGIEVVSGSHTRDSIRILATLSRAQGLLASRGSDYHGPENPRVRLGELAELPQGCTPVWDCASWVDH